MERFTIVTGPAAALLRPNINTDILAPLRRADRPDAPPMLPKTFAVDIGDFLFAPWRYDRNGEIADFVLNRAPFRHAKFLLAGPNFGCGSSRETAVWGLLHFGIRCVIAPSFGTIFHGNCFKNGLLPIALPLELVEHLAGAVERDGVAMPLAVSLVDREIVTYRGERIGFEIEEFRRNALINGLDDIAQTLAYQADIDLFTQADRMRRPWVYT